MEAEEEELVVFCDWGGVTASWEQKYRKYS